jgi:hypothetical protein
MKGREYFNHPDSDSLCSRSGEVEALVSAIIIILGTAGWLVTGYIEMKSTNS